MCSPFAQSPFGPLQGTWTRTSTSAKAATLRRSGRAKGHHRHPHGQRSSTLEFEKDVAFEDVGFENKPNCIFIYRYIAS